jgi:hypothetical protein
MNPLKKTFINPIKEYKHLYHLHTLNNKRSHSLPYLKQILLKEEEEEKKNKQHIVNV